MSELSASAMFPRVDIDEDQEVGDLRRCAYESGRFADRQIEWDKATHRRLEVVEHNSTEALQIVTKLAQQFESDRAHRRRILSYAVGGFTVISFLIQIAVGIWSDMRTEARERARDQRELQLAVEHARQHEARP